MLNLISTNFFNFDSSSNNGQFSPESDAKPEEFSNLMDGLFNYPTNAKVPFQNNLPIVEDHTNVSLTVCTGKMEFELGAKENVPNEPLKSVKEIISEPIETKSLPQNADSTRKQTPLPANTPKGDFPVDSPPILILPNKNDVPVETPPIIILPQQTQINMRDQRFEVAKLNNLTIRREQATKPVEPTPVTPVGTEDWRMNIAKNNRLRVREEFSEIPTTSSHTDSSVESFAVAQLKNNLEKNGFTELNTEFSIDYGKISESPEKKTLENFKTFSMNSEIIQNFDQTPKSDIKNESLIGKIFEYEEIKDTHAIGESSADKAFEIVWNSETETKPDINQISSFAGREFSPGSDVQEKKTTRIFDLNSDAEFSIDTDPMQSGKTSQTENSKSFSDGSGENKNTNLSLSSQSVTEFTNEISGDEKVLKENFSNILNEITDVVQKDETMKNDPVKTENSKPTFVANSNEISEQISSHLVQVAARAEEKKEKQILKMRLHPAELGTVEIQLEKNSNGVLEAKFTTQTDRAGEALSENIEQLRNTLEKAGWNVGAIEVSTTSTPSQFSQNQQNPNQNGNADTFYNSFSNKEFEDSSQNSNSKDENHSHIVSLRA